MLQGIFHSLRQRSRARRYQVIQDRLILEEDSLVLDLGGGPASFFAERYPNRDRVVLLEIDEQRARLAKQKYSELQVVIGNGECLPFAQNSIPYTICNSVIEHVNSPESLASEIRRVSHNYFIQTPNGKFPLETHSFIAIPLFNYLPNGQIKRLVCKIFGANYDYIQSVRYLGNKRLISLFPEAQLEYERSHRNNKSVLLISQT